ncbi:hypothetical protein [Actinomadura gamaensis]|uniref:Uncharacterized protein n=1 Tax=Actinomadura gamaensis TaxID=1763541 RepID=A0ABV9U187_9ACTN
MALSVFHKPPQHGDTERPAPRWAMRTAYALPLLLLPSCLWRLPFAFGFEMGQVDTGGLPSRWISIPYVFGLSVLSEVIAFLCLGLVRGWGETVPGRVPFLGGRRVRPLAAVVPAVLGGSILTLLFTAVPIGDGRRLTLLGTVHDVGYANQAWRTLALVCTAPTIIWGPTVLALAAAYHHRRRPTR